VREGKEVTVMDWEQRLWDAAAVVTALAKRARWDGSVDHAEVLVTIAAELALLAQRQRGRHDDHMKAACVDADLFMNKVRGWTI